MIGPSSSKHNGWNARQLCDVLTNPPFFPIWHAHGRTNRTFPALWPVASPVSTAQAAGACARHSAKTHFAPAKGRYPTLQTPTRTSNASAARTGCVLSRTRQQATLATSITRSSLRLHLTSAPRALRLTAWASVRACPSLLRPSAQRRPWTPTSTTCARSLPTARRTTL